MEFRDVPWVPFEERAICERMGNNCWRVRVRYLASPCCRRHKGAGARSGLPRGPPPRFQGSGMPGHAWYRVDAVASAVDEVAD